MLKAFAEVLLRKKMQNSEGSSYDTRLGKWVSQRLVNSLKVQGTIKGLFALVGCDATIATKRVTKALFGST